MTYIKIEFVMNTGYYNTLRSTAKPVFRGHLWDKEKVALQDRWPLKQGSIFYDRTRKRWPFNTGDCLIEATTA